MGNLKKTLIAVLASHDSVWENNKLAALFEELYDLNRELLGQFHFLFTGGTFKRLVVGEDTELPPREELRPIHRREVRDFIASNSTVLPDRKAGGVTILTNFVVHGQCSIVWSFLSPTTPHWLAPENLAFMRLCDLCHAKRLLNVDSVRGWFREEAKRDTKKNPQDIPIKVTLGTPIEDGVDPVVDREYDRSFYELNLISRKRRTDEFWSRFEEQTIALISHDEMKNLMVRFAQQYENELNMFQRILATGTTGEKVARNCRKLREGNKIRKCLSGPHGGDIEIATEILMNRCHVVVFFIDPLNSHPHIDDIRVVFAACMAEIDNNDVRIFTNEVAAREWIEEAVRRRQV